MIKFFRHFRQKLLSQNKFTQYLIYAIGEIFLVVIGILIALQINTWNQKRIDAKKETAYYQRFLEDVLLDEELIIEQSEATQKRLIAANQLIRTLQNEEDNMDLISTNIGKAVSRSDFGLKPRQTTFEDIKSSGNVHLIKDLEIRKQLDDYYAFMEGLMTTINSNASKLGPRMYSKDQVLGTGLFNLAKNQNAFYADLVDVEKLESSNQLTEINKDQLINDAVFYAAMTSRNLEHFKVLEQKVIEMKAILVKKNKN